MSAACDYCGAVPRCRDAEAVILLRGVGHDGKARAQCVACWIEAGGEATGDGWGDRRVGAAKRGR